LTLLFLAFSGYFFHELPLIIHRKMKSANSSKSQ
jgi:hypothetical protein